MTTLIPARIGLQIRDGVINELHAFDIEVANSTPITEDSNHVEGAVLDHEVNTLDIIKALGHALHEQIEYLRDNRSADIEEDTERYIGELLAWVAA